MTQSHRTLKWRSMNTTRLALRRGAVSSTRQPQFELFPESETKFLLKVVDAKVTFVKDDTGKVTPSILHQGGDRRAKRVN